MAKGRTNPGDVANLMVRCLLADASELLGGWTEADRERTLRFFGGACAYTGASYSPETCVWDHLVPHNQEACGLHVYGNLVPATRQANSAKGAKDFCDFLRHDRACLGDMPAADREDRIRRLEDFLIASGYEEKAQAVAGLQAVCTEQYERVKAICQENKAAIRSQLAGAAVVPIEKTVPAAPRPRRTGETLPIEYEVNPPDRFLAHFLAAGVAYIEEHYADGRVRVREWGVQRLSSDSNLAGNVRSRPEYRQGNWQAAGLSKLVLRLARPNGRPG